MFSCIGYAAETAQAPLARFSFERREPEPTDVRIDILYCGVCHSDIHQARNEWQNALYPCVPGHEIVGRVTAVGSTCSASSRATWQASAAWSIPAAHARIAGRGSSSIATGCSSRPIMARTSIQAATRSAAILGRSSWSRILSYACPTNLELAAVAPLLCAGITTYSPMRHWNVGPGQRVGIVGLGGLGHMGVKFARALGAEVVLFTTSPDKMEDARRLGAHEVVLSRDPDAMAREAGRFDFILDAVAAQHDIDAFLNLLKRDGKTGAGRRARAAASVVGVQPDLETPLLRGLADWRHCRDPGDAGFLRHARDHGRHRNDPDRSDQRSL